MFNLFFYNGVPVEVRQVKCLRVTTFRTRVFRQQRSSARSFGIKFRQQDNGMQPHFIHAWAFHKRKRTNAFPLVAAVRFKVKFMSLLTVPGHLLLAVLPPSKMACSLISNREIASFYLLKDRRAHVRERKPRKERQKLFIFYLKK